MKLIVISRPEFFSEEAEIVNNLFRSGLQCLHLRKPDCEEEQLRSLLRKIDPAFHQSIALHQHHQLATEFGISRLHFTEKERAKSSPLDLNELKNKGYTLSTSVHDPRQLDSLDHAFTYAFLGPVFDSISKTDYRGILENGFQVFHNRENLKVIGLGGIDQSNIRKVMAMRFDGVAVLGAIWGDPDNAIANFGAIRSQMEHTAIAKLHFISNQTPTASHLESIQMALEAGCRWVQLRVKDQPEDEVLRLAREAKNLCDSYQAKLIINDFPYVARTVRAYGLHLGLTDMPISEARAIVGNEMIIGGTANTFDDLKHRIREGADYIGFGPYRFTSTKQNLSPILGLEGYRALVKQMNQSGSSIPIIAIGGIAAGDVPALHNAGAYGVAMSSALLHADNPKETVSQIQRTLC